MADNGGIFLRGRVLDVEHKTGTTTKGSAYSFHIVSVLTGKTVSEIRYANDCGVSVPAEGDDVHLSVSLDVFNGRQQIEARAAVAAPGSGVRAAS